MDALFPIKINIPENLDNYDMSYFSFYQKKEIINCLLLSSEINLKEIKIYNKNEIYPIGIMVKNEKCLNIYYIEVFSDFSDSKIKIDISNNSFFIKLNTIEQKKNYLFNQSLLNQENKEISKLNCFDINEEFEIYYKIHSEGKNINSLYSLISSTLYLIKKGGEESSYSLFLALFIKESFKLNEKENINDILLNIKHKGDLTKISKEELNKIVNSNENKEYGLIIYRIYLILSQQNIEEIKKTLPIDSNLNKFIILYLDRYRNIFLHSLQLFPNYSYLINIAKSLDEIKIILKCSNSLTDFIYILNDKKEFISKFIGENQKENQLILNQFFDLEIAFQQEFDDKFYLVLNNIREFETKIKKKY